MADATDDERRVIGDLRARFHALTPTLATPPPPYLEASAEEIDIYRPHLVREHGWPAIVIKGREGHTGYPFKCVPLTLAGGEEYW